MATLSTTAVTRPNESAFCGLILRVLDERYGFRKLRTSRTCCRGGRGWLWSLSLEIVNLRGHLLHVEPASHRRYFPNLVWTPTSCPPMEGISVSDQGWISCRRNGDITCGAPLEAR